MNIFCVDNDPIISGQTLCDKHTIKMILESAQMLCTTYHILDQKDKIKKIEKEVGFFYKTAHKNHPCTIWTRESLTNFKWLVLHGISLSNEYTERYGKEHKSEKLIRSIGRNLPDIKDIGLTPFRLAMPDQYKEKDLVQSYRNYYMGDKRPICTWKRNRPDWFK